MYLNSVIRLVLAKMAASSAEPVAVDEKKVIKSPGFYPVYSYHQLKYVPAQQDRAPEYAAELSYIITMACYSPVGVWMVDIDGEVIHQPKKAADIVGQLYRHKYTAWLISGHRIHGNLGDDAKFEGYLLTDGTFVKRSDIPDGVLASTGSPYLVKEGVINFTGLSKKGAEMYDPHKHGLAVKSK